MSKDFLVSMLFKMRDEASSSMSRMWQTVKQGSQEATASIDKVGAADARMNSLREKNTAAAETMVRREVAMTGTAYEQQAKLAVAAQETTTRAVDGSLSKRLRDYSRFNQAYETLGVRSEAMIQREIARTEAAYNRLARGGQMSAAEQARAFQKMTDAVAELNREMGRVEAKQRSLGSMLQGGARGIRTAGEWALGAAGAVHAVTEPVHETMGFDRHIAMMANTAFNERDVAGRKKGMLEIRAAISDTVNKYGGNLEQLTATADNLLSHNAGGDAGLVLRMLPTLQKYAAAEGADPNELGSVALKAVQNFGVKESEVGQLFEEMIRGGHLGGFKIKDMSKWLPQQMAVAKNSGLSGLDGVAKLVALNERSFTTAGTVDEAGNNVVDFYTHMNTPQMERMVARYLHRDWAAMMANGRAKGMDAAQVFGSMTEQVMEKDKNYQRLKKALASTKDDEQRKQMLGDMVNIVEGSAIGKVVHQRQFLLAAMAYLNNPEEYKSQAKSIRTSQGNGVKDFDVISDTADFKTERFKSQQEMNKMDAMRPFSEKVGDVANGLSSLSNEYPRLATAVQGAKVAFESATQAILAIGLGRMVFGGGKEAVKETAKETLEKAGANTLAKVGGEAGGFWSKLFKLGGPAGTVNSFANFTTDEEDEEIKNGDARRKKLQAQYGQKLIDAAREKYQPWYQFGDGYASEQEQWVKQYLADQQQAKRNAPIPIPGGASSPATQQQEASSKQLADMLQMQAKLLAQQQLPIPITVPIQVQLDGHVIAEAVNKINAQSALRH